MEEKAKKPAKVAPKAVEKSLKAKAPTKKPTKTAEDTKPKKAAVAKPEPTKAISKEGKIEAKPKAEPAKDEPKPATKLAPEETKPKPKPSQAKDETKPKTETAKDDTKADEKEPKKKAKKKEDEKPKVTLERVYVVPLRGARKAPSTKRAKKGVKILRSFITQHMKAGEVKINPEVSEYIWSHGINNIPSKVKVKAAKAGETVSVTLAK